MKKTVHAQDSATLPLLVAGQEADASFVASPLGTRLLEMRAGASASARSIADFLLRHPVRASACSIEDMAAQTGASPATVSRFARSAGFDGYASLRSTLAATLESVLQPVAKLRESFERGTAANGPIAEGFEASQNALRTTAAAIDPELLAALVQRLDTARTVHVMGFGLSAHLAGILTLGLQPFCPQLINVVEFGGTEVAAGRLMNIGEGDVLIAIAFPRYAADVVRLVEYARARGAHIVAITDGPLSPLAPLADTLLAAGVGHPVLSSSLVAPLSVIEALVTAMMISKRENIDKAARLTEAISAHLYTPQQRGR